MKCDNVTSDLLQPIVAAGRPVHLLALGQTVFWDEPTKAGILARIKNTTPGVTVTVGIHDTDYFAKASQHPKIDVSQPYAILGHDDWMTRGLWSAAGELHRLFGSEDPPLLSELSGKGGVSIHAVRSTAANSDATLSSLTAADGWTGIVQTGWKKVTVRDVKLSGILPYLVQQLTATLQASEACVDDASSEIRLQLIAWVETFAAANPGAKLADLYADILPRLHARVNGSHVIDHVTRTSELLAFSTDTAGLPRFALLALFLHPETFRQAAAAYDAALDGADMYPLSLFGDGATPFDVCVPGKGRGTLFVHSDRIEIDFDVRETIYGSVCNTHQLAEILEAAGYEDSCIVGKAVALLPMLGAEYTIAFHEGASGYSHLSSRFVANIRAAGLPLPEQYPIIRIGLDAWSALSAAPPVTFKLPAPLAQAVGRPSIDADDIALCWNKALSWETARLNELKGIRSPRALANHLAGTEGQPWCTHYKRLTEIDEAIMAHAEATQPERDSIAKMRGDLHTLRQQRTRLEAEKGADFRARGGVLDTANVALRTSTFDVPLAALDANIHALHLARRAARRALRLVENASDVKALRAERANLVGTFETRRAELAANALRVIHGLPHAGARPSSWWFPLVDPSGAWYRKMISDATLRLEALEP